MNNKVYNVDIKELVATLSKLAENYDYVDFEIEAHDGDGNGINRIMIYPVEGTPKKHHPPTRGLDSRKDLDDLAKDLT